VAIQILVEVQRILGSVVDWSNTVCRVVQLALSRWRLIFLTKTDASPDHKPASSTIVQLQYLRALAALPFELSFYFLVFVIIMVRAQRFIPLVAALWILAIEVIY
jgi:hypothetical protein